MELLQPRLGRPVGEQYILDAAGLEDGRQKENIEPRYVGYK